MVSHLWNTEFDWSELIPWHQSMIAIGQFHKSVIQNAPDKLTVILSPKQGNRVPSLN